MIAPKEIYSDSMIVEIAIYIATVIFNEGYISLLTILQTLNCTIGNAAYYVSRDRRTAVFQRTSFECRKREFIVDR